jgi:hypothetical protein
LPQTRHCEERSDEAIQLRAKRAKEKKRGISGEFSTFWSAPAGARLDCFASLAMTRRATARSARDA